MSLDEELQKTEMAGFVELFKIDSGDSVALYTSGRDPVEFPGEVYRPAPIKRGSFSLDSSMGKTEVTISAPPVDELTRYLPNYPILPTWVTISQLVHGEEEAVNLFYGRVVTVSVADNIASAVCRSGSSILSAELPRLVYSSMCQNDLFDTGCGIPASDYQTTAQVTVYEGTLIAPEFALQDDGWYTGGTVVYGSDMRLIVDHVGDTLSLQVPFDSSVGDGTTVYAYPGCDKTAETCKTKFGNIRRGSSVIAAGAVVSMPSKSNDDQTLTTDEITLPSGTGTLEVSARFRQWRDDDRYTIICAIVAGGVEHIVDTITDTEEFDRTKTLSIPFSGGGTVYATMSIDVHDSDCKVQCSAQITEGSFLGEDGAQGFLGMPYIPTTNPVLWGFK